MDYEKKDFRKLYEDLVKSDWFKKAYHDKSLGDCPFDIPELRESEDERIRKGLIEALKTPKTVGELKFILPEPTREECIAYLEKQKENPKSADSIPSDCVSDAKCEDRSPKHSDSDGTDIRDTPAYWKGWDDAMKQKEQKHPNGCFTCDEYKKGYESGRSNGFTAGYNKAMKEVDQEEQQPAEWSEEETKDLVHILKVLDDCYIYGKHDLSKTDYDNLTSTLKSLRPSWKPSKEQMDALAKAVTFFKTKWTGAKVKEQLALESLFGDLERLI